MMIMADRDVSVAITEQRITGILAQYWTRQYEFVVVVVP